MKVTKIHKAEMPGLMWCRKKCSYTRPGKKTRQSRKVVRSTQNYPAYISWGWTYFLSFWLLCK